MASSMLYFVANLISNEWWSEGAGEVFWLGCSIELALYFCFGLISTPHLGREPQIVIREDESSIEFLFRYAKRESG